MILPQSITAFWSIPNYTLGGGVHIQEELVQNQCVMMEWLQPLDESDVLIITPHATKY